MLQYEETRGFPLLRAYLGVFMEESFQPAINDMEVIMTCGSIDGFGKILRLLVGPGQSIMSETPAYTTALQVAKGLHIPIVPIAIDHDGIQVSNEHGLTNTLKNWPSSSEKPRVLYTVPYVTRCS